MIKTSVVRTVNVVLPLVGIPLKNYNNTYVSTKINHKCTLKAFYRLTKCQKGSSYVSNSNLSLHTYIENYINNVVSEILDMCIEGSIDIECEYKIPELIKFVIATTEILFNMFNVKRIEYDEYLRTLSILDNRFWGVEPSYITSLRCAYIYERTCICRNIHDVVKFDPIAIDVEFVDEFNCRNSDSCLELESPFDNVTTIYLLKFTTHIVAKIAQDLLDRGSISRHTINHLNLLHDIETRTVVEAFNRNISLKYRDSHTIKPVIDIASIKFYSLEIDKDVRV